MLHLGPGSRVLDVGCGAGGAVRLLARTIPGVRSVGVDPNRLAIAEAIKLTPRNGKAGSVRTVYLVTNGRQLAFADASFDAAFCTRVLVHAREPDAIRPEMLRVVRLGGRLLLVEPDRDGMLSSVDRDDVNRRFWSERHSANPDIGRTLYPLLRAHGLDVERVEPSFTVSLEPPSAGQVRQLEAALVQESSAW